MQRYTVYFIWKLLYMFRVSSSPIIRSANNSIYSIWYLSHRYCYLPLSWKSWNRFLSVLWVAYATHSTLKLVVFNVHGYVHRNNIVIYIQQDATLHSLFYLETVLNVSGGIITHHQECKQQYLQHLVSVTPLLLSAAIVEELEMV
jgi:hypothetical protein